MAIDVKRILPAELIRLLNSTAMGQVITERRLYRHRQQAGLRIGDGRRVNLPRYAAWLIDRLSSAGEVSGVDDQERKAQQYEAHKRRAAKRQADIAESGQEIGPPPPVVDADRREKCRNSFRLFCETYLRAWFYMGWSKDHLKAIKKIEMAVLEGRLFALAMPRGGGKTTLCLAAVIWAAVYGHHQYIVLIGATQPKAKKLLRTVYNSLERNPLLFEDFPKICFPIRKLERTPQRTAKQKCNGEYTSMTWTKLEIVLPTIEGSAASGTVVTVCGMNGGEIRGQFIDMPDGGILRPSLVLLDDPQTKGSAKSQTQTQDRMELLEGDVLGMAGPDKLISGMMPCTVIRPGDMADQILSLKDHPDWHGERTKMVYAWPENEVLWEEYAIRRADGLRKQDTSGADKFYRDNRAAMDAGADLAWPERFTPDCISALQYAMNLKLRNETMFFAEFQNEPMVDQDESELLTAEQIAEKINRRKESSVPTSCTKLAMYIDVHRKLLYYAIIAFEPNFTGYVVEYGEWPEQKRQHYSLRQVRRTLLTKYRRHGEEAAIYAGLEALTEAKLAKSWTRDDGAAMRIDRCLIDSGYQKDTVELFVRQSRFAGIVMSSKGIPISASSIPLNERKKKRGQQLGDNWRISGRQGEHSVRLLLIDVNHWKSFLHARWCVGIGDAGCLSLWGRSKTRHRLISEHMIAEGRIRTEGRGRKIDEWKLPPSKPDNHWFDCAVGCMVAANMAGCVLLSRAIPGKRRRPKKKKKASYF